MMVLAAATTVLPASGCSFLFFDRPSEYRNHEKTTCTTENVLPAFDIGFALLHVVSIAILASASGDAYGGEKARSQLAGFDLSWLILHGASAGYGFSWASECRELVGDDDASRRRPVPRRPPARVIAPAAAAPSPQPAQPPPPEAPAPAQPAAASPAPPAPPPVPAVPQRIDNE